MHTWPEADGDGPHERDPSWRPLYLSFHRTTFLQALADVLRTLWQHAYRSRRSRAAKAGGPPPRWWSVRAMPEGSHSAVTQFLGGLDSWVNVLYPGDSLPDLSMWPWELDQLVSTFIAASSALDVAEAWRRSDRQEARLMVPKALCSPGLDRTTQILEHFGRVCAERQRPRFLNDVALAHISLAGRHEKLGQLLFPRNGRPRIFRAHADRTRTLMMAVALGCSESVDRRLAQDVLEATSGPRNVHRDALTLREYGTARRIVLGSERAT